MTKLRTATRKNTAALERGCTRGRRLQNEEIARALDQIADHLDIEGENPFSVRAFQTAAGTIRGLVRPVVDVVASGEDLTDLPGIGKSIAQTVAELLSTGHIAKLDELEQRVGYDIAALLSVAGLGPKRVQTLHEKLGISDLDELEAAAAARRIRELPGFGERTEDRILASLHHLRGEGARTPWFVAGQSLAPMLAHLRSAADVRRVEVAGSFRRGKDTVGDLDLLATSERGQAVVEALANYEEAVRVLARGSTRGTIVLRSSLQVDLRVVPDESYGAALLYLTGSKAHNVAIRRLGVERGLKINEYGVYRGRRRIAGRTEEEVYAAVGLPYIEPELREDRGEIDAARRGGLPCLVRVEDLRGDLHAHTVASDGTATVAEMAEAARRRGYEYLAISDHTEHTRVARGLSPDRLKAQIDEIDRLNASRPGIRVLRSAEVDILRDGSLDLPDALLERLDLVVGAVHSSFDLPSADQTARILRAFDHPRLHVLAHPTGRLLGERPGLAIDLDRILRAAAEHGVALEVNAQPHRMDLDDIACRAARAAGAKLVISTDAHGPHQLDYLRLGVAHARRGWIEREQVLNTLSWKGLSGALRRGSTEMRADSAATKPRRRPEPGVRARRSSGRWVHGRGVAATGSRGGTVFARCPGWLADHGGDRPEEDANEHENPATRRDPRAGDPSDLPAPREAPSRGSSRVGGAGARTWPRAEARDSQASRDRASCSPEVTLQPRPARPELDESTDNAARRRRRSRG